MSEALIDWFLGCTRYDEAEMYAEQALPRDPRNFKARYRRGLARTHSGRLRSAKMGEFGLLSPFE